MSVTIVDMSMSLFLLTVVVCFNICIFFFVNIQCWWLIMVVFFINMHSCWIMMVTLFVNVDTFRYSVVIYYNCIFLLDWSLLADIIAGNWLDSIGEKTLILLEVNWVNFVEETADVSQEYESSVTWFDVNQLFY